MLKKELERFIEEDMPYGDITTQNLIEATKEEASVICNEKAILCGVNEAEEVFEYFGLETETYADEGDFIKDGDKVLSVLGCVPSILKAERLALNFLTRMSGISTKTRKFVDKARKVNSDVVIAGTRKTTPGFRKYEKKAIQTGEGVSHRMSLSDSVLIKDNHIKAVGFEEILDKTSDFGFNVSVEIEVEEKEEAIEAAKKEAVDIIMLDNFTSKEVEEIIEALKKNGLRKEVIIEVSGG